MREFRDEVLSIARLHFPDRRFDPGPTDDVIETDPSPLGSNWIYLNNLFAKTRSLPAEERDAEILEFVCVVAQESPIDEQPMLDDWTKAMPLLRPKLVRTDVPNVELYVRRPFSAKLFVSCALDLGNRDLYVFNERLAKWGVPAAVVHEAALSNLERMSQDVILKVMRSDARTALVIVNKADFYDAYRILSPTIRRRLIKELGPRVVAGIPDRSVLFAWSAGMAGQDGLIDQVRRDAIEQPYALTDEIFVLSEHEVRVASSSDLAPP